MGKQKNMFSISDFFSSNSAVGDNRFTNTASADQDWHGQYMVCTVRFVLSTYFEIFPKN
jgi:hypothetical protein